MKTDTEKEIKQATSDKILPGGVDVWLEYFDLDFGYRVSCTLIRGLLYYMASPSTSNIVIQQVRAGTRQIDIAVYGPICDDDKPLFAEMRIGDLHIKNLFEQERTAFARALKEHVRTTGDPAFRSPHSWRSACYTVGLPNRV